MIVNFLAFISFAQLGTFWLFSSFRTPFIHLGRCNKSAV